jgi:hypothetical protein
VGVARDAVGTWTLALLRTFDDAAEHLRYVIFEAGWDELRAQHASDDAALRASALLYEQALADLLRAVRATGLPANPVDWSRLKADWRHAAVDQGLEVTLRTALGEALYAAERTPLGDHAAYEAWALAMTAFLRSLAGAPNAAADDERLAWAYTRLAHLEEHAAFHAAFAAYAGPDTPAVAHQTNLLSQPRFDLILNAAVRWLADGGGNREQGTGNSGFPEGQHHSP